MRPSGKELAQWRNADAMLAWPCPKWWRQSEWSSSAMTSIVHCVTQHSELPFFEGNMGVQSGKKAHQDLSNDKKSPSKVILAGMKFFPMIPYRCRIGCSRIWCGLFQVSAFELTFGAGFSQNLCGHCCHVIKELTFIVNFNQLTHTFYTIHNRDLYAISRHLIWVGVYVFGKKGKVGVDS